MAFVPPPGCDSLLVTNIINVRYLTGFTGSSGCVLMTPRQQLFFTDFRYRVQASRQVDGYSVRIVKAAPAAGAASHALAHHVKLGVLGFEGANLSRRSYLELKRLLPGVRLKDASGAIERQRVVKTRREVDLIRRAAALGDDALAMLARSRVIGRSEREVAWMLERRMRESGSEPIPFEIIVASGTRSAMPHGVASEKIIGEDELVVVDLGARVGGYGSDITRTFATGKVSRQQQRIFDVVHAAQAKALAAVAPGVECAAIDAVARGFIDRAGFGGDFGHSLGHGVGLEPHEAPVLATGAKGILLAGTVVTIEPGVYRSRAGGVRIEDTVVVGAAGVEILTSAPRGLRRLR